MALVLRGRTAVITGAAGGIGRGLAIEAASRGMNLALADVDERGLSDVARTAREKGAQVFLQRVDVRDPHEVSDFAQAVFTAADSIALVFANAGVVRAGSVFRMSPEDVDFVIDVNLRGAVHTMNAFMPGLLAQAQVAQFVFVGSQASLKPVTALGIYSATKHALWALAESLQIEIAANPNLGVSLICPGAVRTNIMTEQVKRVIRGDISPAQNADIEATRMTPEMFARLAMDAVANRLFWVFTHPEFLKDVSRRFEYVLQGRTPES